ncbi:MAG: phosphate ABC transporter permease subunit PstC [Nitrospirae bacterium CG08_land_8_20_14_0_20_52_24]|nr:MAG: phosphate ABC transporter permease subunit PstC [Nitrospirae bacterium CG08_land_8_20_14_0_20_52_24]PIV85369.1 MAG: phosphate ABC transporter permease subunit PstC [Nitrospirae bacterium CG17_big_fil_post_rev_8_21_14_2_50_50_9]PIW85672.1 MAG: phosphate ABC transporter permease subunit PstC [Nitrospirae bacterium CG_4_8_14_3_um_filter_50_41]PIX84617.1 MAG: phosphate ABC transporter permease subunit PstC [Nitrospirae bacterium CG_4_10_14_3_um_filter_53_41]
MNHSQKRKIKETAIEAVLLLCAFFSVFITLSIVFILSYESFGFFKEVSLKEFFTGTQWTPLFAEPKFGILPLVSGTLLTTSIALIVALPLGLTAAVYLSEYAPHRLKESIKPILELLAAVPTVVYGYFALLFLTPILQKFIPDLSGFNALSPGIIMGIMIIPYVSSVSEDAMRAVPMHIREGSYAMGATKLQTAFKVIIPSAFSGIAAAFIIGISRAIGETMVVAIAAGGMPNLTANPLEPVQTLTAFIVQVSLGDAPHGTVEYKTIFAAGITLFFMTLGFNILGFWLRKRIREVY